VIAVRRPERGPLPLPRKLLLAAEVWRLFAQVRARIYREPLPDLVADLVADEGRYDGAVIHPRRLSRAVHRSLRIGRRRPTCLMASLVLFRLLRRQGHDAALVIGLPPNALHARAHAWIELNGHDLGPPPGRGDHQPMARFPA
jgi:hypothetical protein